MSFVSSSLVFENTAGRLFEHPDGYVLLQYRPGLREMSDFQALLTHISLLLRRHGWYRVLADQRRMTPFTEPETAWASTFWRSADHQPTGGLVVAVILADDVFARLATNLMRETVASATAAYRLFQDEASAVGWLRQVI